MAKAQKKKKESPELTKFNGYLDHIAKYEREYKSWERRVDKLVKRYRDEGRDNRDNTSSKFNIFWSNVQILVPATFARIPQPDVSRRFRDQDPTGRVGALILERGLEFEVQHYPDYRDTMTQCVQDRFLGGRGTCWIRYEPHFKDGEASESTGQVTDDVQASEQDEQLDYECAPVDYVHPKDFGHSVCRTWEENTLVWRWVYMSEDAVTERFGEDIAKKLPYDSTPEDLKSADRKAQVDIKQQAKICELWDKEERCVYWFSKSMKQFLDEKPDPLKLQQFFPCPKPLYSTLTNDSLIPVPDFTLYQDQARALDTLADRITGLIEMLQLKGVYDGSADASLARLFTEGNNGKLIPVKNWAAFAEKNGLKGQIDVYDLTPIAKALEAAYLAAENIKNQIYEIMGISDIVRGQSDPNETLGAQELKGQYASMRLRAMQADVARFATDVLQLKAQVMCSKFQPQTLVAISAADQLSDIDKQSIYLMIPPQVDPMTGQPTPPQPIPGPDGQPIPQGPAMELLIGKERLQDPEAESPNPLRSFRIEVNADSMIQMDEAKEKADGLEFLSNVAVFLEKGVPLVQAAPMAGPLVLELLKIGIRAFKIGKTVEGKLDELIDQMNQQPAQTPADPELMKAKAQIEQTEKEGQIKLQIKGKELEMKEREMQMKEEHMQRESAIDAQVQQQEAVIQQQAGQQKLQQNAAMHQQKMTMAAQRPQPGQQQGRPN